MKVIHRVIGAVRSAGAKTVGAAKKLVHGSDSVKSTAPAPAPANTAAKKEPTKKAPAKDASKKTAPKKAAVKKAPAEKKAKS